MKMPLRSLILFLVLTSNLLVAQQGDKKTTLFVSASSENNQSVLHFFSYSNKYILKEFISNNHESKKQLFQQYADCYKRLQEHSSDFVSLENTLKNDSEPASFNSNEIISQLNSNQKNTIILCSFNYLVPIISTLKDLEAKNISLQQKENLCKQAFIYSTSTISPADQQYLKHSWPQLQVVQQSNESLAHIYCSINGLNALENLKQDLSLLDKYVTSEKIVNNIQQEYEMHKRWCQNRFNNVNHAPNILWKQGQAIQVHAGETISIKYACEDPDFHVMIPNVFQVKEAGTGKADISWKATLENISISLPKNVHEGETYPMILEIKDEGAPSLSSFQQFVLQII